jgi:hypothetical protein
VFLRKPCHWIQIIQREEIGSLCVPTSCFLCDLNLDGSFSKHLPKYSSLPEFQFVVKETSSYHHCRQCGVINPTCLCCKQAPQQHEFASSAPLARARRASAPSRVLINLDLSPWKLTFLTGDHANIDFNRPEPPLKQKELSSTIDPLPFVSSKSPYMPVDQTLVDGIAMDLHRDHIDDTDTNINDYGRQRGVHPVPECLGDVATATCSVWGKKLLQKSIKSNPSLF